MQPQNKKERESHEELQRGSIPAFEAILFTYEKPIFSYLKRLTGSIHDAEDLTQETFVKVYLHRYNLKKEASLKSWIFTLATHVAYDFLRKKRGKPVISLAPEDFETFEAVAPSYNMEEVNDVERALLLLKPLYHSILLLYYKEGFTYQEISSLLHIPLNTVKTNLFRAKKSLKEIMKKEYESYEYRTRNKQVKK